MNVFFHKTLVLFNNSFDLPIAIAHQSVSWFSMNRNAQELQAVERAEAELVDESATFFAPVCSDLLDGLLGQYQVRRRNIEQLAEALQGEEFKVAMGYFLEASEERGHRLSINSLADVDAAMAVLDASYWAKALALTDVLDSMPQARRDEWNKAIADRKTVPFTEEAVRPTIADLLASRHKFFSERVDGIFPGLSGDHVTNQPQGFSKRMILAYVIDDHGYASHSRAGLINDLRDVIAMFMGTGPQALRDVRRHQAHRRERRVGRVA
jgi:hypothetical protein